jgi:RimJ/RimL family protein N-acetyltransferase
VIPGSVCLTEFRRADKATLVESLNDRQIYDCTLRVPYPYTDAHAEEWLELDEQATLEHGQPVRWAIRNSEDRLIGAIGFRGLEIGKGHRAEIGYWVARPFWGRGIMTAVVRKACEFAFAEWKLTKITAEVFRDNLASAHVLEKCGFELEGHFRKHFLKDGKYIDVKSYALFA